ncbi:hypothetical protein [Viscerimonas tarda]
MGKIKLYWPLFMSLVLLIILAIIKTEEIYEVNNILFAIAYILLAISFPYVVIKEAERFRRQGRYKTTYRLTFGAGFICSMFLLKAIEYLF